MKRIDAVAMVLIMIGAFNWGLVGVFRIDVVSLFFQNPVIERLVSILIGVAGLFKLIYWFTGRWTTKFVELED